MGSCAAAAAANAEAKALTINTRTSATIIKLLQQSWTDDRFVCRSAQERDLPRIDRQRHRVASRMNGLTAAMRHLHHDVVVASPHAVAHDAAEEFALRHDGRNTTRSNAD